MKRARTKPEGDASGMNRQSLPSGLVTARAVLAATVVKRVVLELGVAEQLDDADIQAIFERIGAEAYAGRSAW